MFTKDKETNIRIQNLTSKLAVPKKQMLLQSRSLQIQELEKASHIETYRIQNLTSKLAVPEKQMLLQSRSSQIQELEIASHIETYLIVSAITTFKRVSPIFHHR